MFKDLTNFLNEKANDMTLTEAFLLEECIGEATIEDAILGEAVKNHVAKMDATQKASEDALIDALADDVEEDEAVLTDVATLDNDPEIKKIADSIPGDEFTSNVKGSKIKDVEVKEADKVVHEPTIDELAESVASELEDLDFI